uniref:Uncharacterized protein n=1 Tax=Panagrolaimus superbus TaxID=310955 RepID=A0A914Z6F1_9BILA
MDGGLYKFSFHPSGSPKSEPPAAHAAMFGNMGSETDPQGKAWLTDWLTALLDRDDKKFSAVQRQAISDAVNQNAVSPNNLRNFKHFPDLFSHIDDDGDLQQRVREWCLDGRFGWVFGENEIENFSMNNQVMGFDMTNVLDAGDEKEKTAILGYLFRLIEKKLQLTSSKLGDSMLQAIRTQIVLPNRNADASNYASIKLNDRELHTVLNTPAGMRVALIRNDTESVTVNTNLAALGEYLNIIGGGNTGEKALEQYKAGKSNV